MVERSLAERVVARMYENDPFSLWLGIKRVTVDTGVCVLELTVRKEMLNGFAFAHGGITYTLADSCLAFASNSHGIQAVSVETSISHTKAVKEGDVLTAMAEEMSLSNRIASTTFPLPTSVAKPSRSSRAPFTALVNPGSPMNNTNKSCADPSVYTHESITS